MSESKMVPIEATIAERQTAMMNSERGLSVFDESLFGNLGDRRLRESHGFRGSPSEVWKQLALASATDVKSGDDIIGKPFQLENFYCHEVDLTERNGMEGRRAIRTVLYLKGGERVAFVSDGIVRDLLRIISAFGPPAWKDLPKLLISQVKTGQGYRTYRILPA